MNPSGSVMFLESEAPSWLPFVARFDKKCSLMKNKAKQFEIGEGPANDKYVRRIYGDIRLLLASRAR